jgi:predicted RNase H-like HicB family nuclease
MKKIYSVAAQWDDDAEVWFASSDDVPGLAIEAATTEALIQELETLIPDLLEMNGQKLFGPVAFELFSRRFVVI